MAGHKNSIRDIHTLHQAPLLDTQKIVQKSQASNKIGKVQSQLFKNRVEDQDFSNNLYNRFQDLGYDDSEDILVQLLTMHTAIHNQGCHHVTHICALGLL